MVSYSGKTLTIILLLLILKLDPVSPQELGNPISNLYTNEFSVSLYGEIVSRDLDDASYSSYRAITKTEYGFYDRLKIFALFGMERMFIDNPKKSMITDYKGKNELAFGGGAQVELFKVNRTVFFGGAGIFSTYSRGSVINKVLEQEITIDMDFNWKEYWFAFGTAHNFKKFEIYGGLEERTTKRFEKNSESEYVSGLKPNLFVGIDLNLSKSLILSIQAKTLDQNAITFGISQRSIGRLK